MLRDANVAELKSRGITYVVVKNPSNWNGGTAVYSNSTYSVYKL